jgi:SP family xylose:H+ symportor-like MFS transporter
MRSPEANLIFEAPTVNAPEQEVRRLYLILITLVAALGGLLFGYDTAVIAGAIGFLQKDFGLSPAASGWAASSALAGCVLGAALAGALGDRSGRRIILLLSAALFLISAIGSALAPSLAVLVLFRIVAGMGIGAASMTSPLYIAEIAPATWRGRLVGLNQLAIVSGMLLIYFVNYRIARFGTLEWDLTTGWRWMFASGALPSALLLALLFLVPETPHFLVTHGRLAEAAKVLQRTGASMAPERVRTPFPLGGRPMMPLLGIGITLAVLQQVTGINVFLYYAPEIFSAASHNLTSAMYQTILVGATNFLFTALAMTLVDRAGRKPLLICGSMGMGLCLIAIGRASMLSVVGPSLLLFVLGYIACFALSVGPITWVVLSELFPTALRNRAMAIATMALWLANFGVSQTFPMLDQSKYLISRFNHAFPFFLYAVFCVLEALFVWRFIPETKGCSLEDIGSST